MNKNIEKKLQKNLTMVVKNLQAISYNLNQIYR